MVLWIRRGGVNMDESPAQRTLHAAATTIAPPHPLSLSLDPSLDVWESGLRRPGSWSNPESRQRQHQIGSPPREPDRHAPCQC